MQRGITVKADRPSPEEIVEVSRRLLNNRVEELHRNNGITMQSDLTIMDAVAAIRALTDTPHPRRVLQAPLDRAIIKKARWHNASLLSVYLDRKSEEYQRDSYQCGVYTLFELKRNELVPLFVEALPKYVGMSTILSKRLVEHATGGFGSTPANHVIQEFLLTCTRGERAAYSVASRREQLELRRLAMAQRGLWVRTTHTSNKKAADELEHAMTRHYEGQGRVLWNDIKYPHRG